jgi:hypothetical protein
MFDVLYHSLTSMTRTPEEINIDTSALTFRPRSELQTASGNESRHNLHLRILVFPSRDISFKPGVHEAKLLREVGESFVIVLGCNWKI